MNGAVIKDLNAIMLKIILVQHAQQIQDMIDNIKVIMDVTKIGKTKYVPVDGQEMDQNLIINDIDEFDNFVYQYYLKINMNNLNFYIEFIYFLIY